MSGIGDYYEKFLGLAGEFVKTTILIQATNQLLIEKGIFTTEELNKKISELMENEEGVREIRKDVIENLRKDYLE